MAEITTEELTALEEALGLNDCAVQEALGVYETMTEAEQRAFDLGGAHMRMVIAHTSLEDIVANLRKRAE